MAEAESKRVLIADDEINIRRVLEAILKRDGYDVVTAANGEEALATLEAHANDASKPIDLVLMDVMMPVMDGLEATRRIRKSPALAKTPINMLTAKAMPDDQARCIEAGANDYMAKPIDVDKLLSLVRVWMPR